MREGIVKQKTPSFFCPFDIEVLGNSFTPTVISKHFVKKAERSVVIYLPGVRLHFQLLHAKTEVTGTESGERGKRPFPFALGV